MGCCGWCQAVRGLGLGFRAFLGLGFANLMYCLGDGLGPRMFVGFCHIGCFGFHLTFGWIPLLSPPTCFGLDATKGIDTRNNKGRV